MPVLEHLSVVSFTHPETNKRGTGLVVDEPKKKRTRVFISATHWFHTNPNMNRAALLQGLKCSPAPESALDSELAKVRQRLQNPVKYTKGMVVSVTGEDGPFTGRVLKGGSDKITVAMGPFQSAKAETIYMDPIDNFPSEGPMAGYSVSGYTLETGHNDSTPYTATILKDGQPILKASNGGFGEPDLIDAISPENENSTAAFYEAIRQTFTEIEGKPSDGERCAPLWLFWDWYYRPMGISLKRYITDSSL